MKTCRGCGRELPLTEFYPIPRSKTGTRNVCKSCISARVSSRQAQARAEVREHGHPEPSDSDIKRFFRKIVFEPMTGCWLWSALTNELGYGRFTYGGSQIKAHRFSYLITGAQLDPELVLDQLCRTPQCVNPGHLEQVTQAANVNRGMCPTMVNVRAGVCHLGHPMTGDNVKVYSGVRYCHACIMIRLRRNAA